MGATNATTALGLPLFADNDRPTWRGDFNGAMDLLDTAHQTTQALIDDNAATNEAAHETFAARSDTDLAFMSDTNDLWDGVNQSIKVGADRAFITALLAGVGESVAVGRKGNDYNLYQHLGGNKWWRITLAYDAAVGETHHSLYQSVIGSPVLSVDQTDAAWVFTVPGAGWVTSANPLVYGGSYNRNASAGSVATWTTPATATSVGLRAYRTTNGGYALVTVDGDTALANLLPTAQDEVNAGRLPATALIANGGTLNPTDRLYDSYGLSTSNPDAFVAVADGLDAAAHVVVLTNTGYKQIVSTDIRLYVSGGYYSNDDISIETAGMNLNTEAELLYSSSVYEYAITFTPTGGASTPFIGNRHGNEIEDSFVISLDGSVVAPADGSIAVGKVLTVTRATHFTHPDTTDVVANGECVYTMTPGGGLNVSWSITWAKGGTARTAYVGMLPTQRNSMIKGRCAGSAVQTLTDDDGSVKGSTRSDALALWSDGGNAAVMLTVNNLAEAVNRWQNAPTSWLWLEDRLGGDFNKGYLQRVQSGETETIAVNDVWHSDLTYRAAYLSSTYPLAG